jgi:hypothetical protein
MSYHRALGLPQFASTQTFAEAVDPYSWRFSPPGAIYSPYGWGPDFMVGMPMNYTHHIGYEKVPVPGARKIGPMYDDLSPYAYGVRAGRGQQRPPVRRQAPKRVAVSGLGTLVVL